jgi:hypothetical protein
VGDNLSEQQEASEVHGQLIAGGQDYDLGAGRCRAWAWAGTGTSAREELFEIMADCRKHNQRLWQMNILVHFQVTKLGSLGPLVWRVLLHFLLDGHNLKWLTSSLFFPQHYWSGDPAVASSNHLEICTARFAWRHRNPIKRRQKIEATPSKDIIEATDSDLKEVNKCGKQ